MEAATKQVDAPVSSPRTDAPETKAELPKLLDLHAEWLSSGGESGKQADLSGAQLAGAELTDANLRNARLHNVKLQGADLLLADLEGASLLEADLERCNLLGARFHCAGLQAARLEGATGLLSGQLAGANLLGAVLPEPDCAAESLGHVRELARRSGRLLAALVLLDVLACLRVVTAHDAALLENASSLPLSGARAVLPLLGFFLFAPVMILGLYALFHLYLQRLWQGAAALPAVFPDGRRLDSCLPWFARWPAREGFRWLHEPRLPLAWMERALAMALVYWLVPASMILFWARYLTLQDLRGTMLHILLAAAAVAAALYFPAAAVRAFSGDSRSAGGNLPHSSRKEIVRRAAPSLGASVLLFLLSVGVIFGAPHRAGQMSNGSAGGLRTWAADLFWLAGYNPYARLNESDVSMRPSGWSGKDEDLAAVHGAAFDGLRLRYLQAYGAFFARARFWHADLRNAYLSEADLREANLRQADLRSAVLDQARMRGAVLQEAALQHCDLNQADLRGANFSYASLADATLLDARLAGASLYSADLRGALLLRAGLGQADLREAKLQGADMGMADLHRAYLMSAKMSGAHLEEAQLTEAILAGTDLRQADLHGANLEGAVLRGADLGGANLAGADLRGARGATAAQLCSASNIHGAQLDDALQQQVTAQCGNR